MCRRLLVASVAVAALAAACSSAEKQVDFDGGTADVVVLGDVVVGARPGQRVILRNRGGSLHALVGPGEKLPPLFARQAGGLVPTPTVWGPKHDVEAWDGRSYWATGTMRPSELREIPLADAIPDGKHILTCALHPDLRVVLDVGGEDGPRQSDTEPVVRTARQAVENEADGPSVTVTAGVVIDGAYVAAFSPKIVRVPVGGVVTWRAVSRTPADVVFGAAPSLSRTVPPDGLTNANATGWDGTGVLRSGFLSADPAAGTEADEWTVKFTRPGSYRYVSRFAEAMTGTVVVG